MTILCSTDKRITDKVLIKLFADELISSLKLEM